MFAWTLFVTLLAAGSAYVITGATPSVTAAATVLDNTVYSLANLAAAPSSSSLALNITANITANATDAFTFNNTATSIVNNTAISIVNNTASSIVNNTATSIVNNTATFINSTDTSIVNNTATFINSTATSIANNTVAVLAAAETSQAVVQVIVIQIISFFIYVESLGGPPPSVLSSGNFNAPFVVLDVFFIDLTFAAFHVCAVQLNTCILAVNSGGASFSAENCYAQHSRCANVASTATPEATPATLAATATIVNSVSSTSTLSTNTGVGNNLAILNPAESSAVCLPTTVTLVQAAVQTVSSCTVTEFVTLSINTAASAGFGTASAGWNGLGVHHKPAHTGVRKGGKRD